MARPITFGKPEIIVTDKLRSYGAAMKVIGNADRQETGRWLGFLDTYRTMCIAPSSDFRQVLEDVWELKLAT